MGRLAGCSRSSSRRLINFLSTAICTIQWCRLSLTLYILHFETIDDITTASGLPPAEHPLISVLAGLKTCPFGGKEFTTNCYMIAFKKFRSGVMLYGRTSYDQKNSCLSFIRPRQVMQFNNLDLEEGNFIICIHTDFLIGHHLYNEIKK